MKGFKYCVEVYIDKWIELQFSQVFKIPGKMVNYQFGAPQTIYLVNGRCILLLTLIFLGHVSLQASRMWLNARTIRQRTAASGKMV